MAFDSIGFGILSWKGGPSLDNALNSYQKENFFSLFSENTIFLPENDVNDSDTARKYPLNIYTSENNLGILGGFKALAQSMTSDIIILVENDCPLIQGYLEAKQQIQLGYDLLQDNKADIIRLRSREYPGQDWAVQRKYREYYPTDNASLWEILYKKRKRLLRPNKSNRLKALSLYEGDHEAKKFPEYVNYNEEKDYFSTKSTYMPWTNQSIMVKREFFLKNIIAVAENTPSTRRINGFKNLEIEMNTSYWKKAEYKIIIPKGIFTHHRIGHRGYQI